MLDFSRKLPLVPRDHVSQTKTAGDTSSESWPSWKLVGYVAIPSVLLQYGYGIKGAALGAVLGLGAYELQKRA